MRGERLLNLLPPLRPFIIQDYRRENNSKTQVLYAGRCETVIKKQRQQRHCVYMWRRTACSCTQSVKSNARINSILKCLVVDACERCIPSNGEIVKLQSERHKSKCEMHFHTRHEARPRTDYLCSRRRDSGKFNAPVSCELCISFLSENLLPSTLMRARCRLPQAHRNYRVSRHIEYVWSRPQIDGIFAAPRTRIRRDKPRWITTFYKYFFPYE